MTKFATTTEKLIALLVLGLIEAISDGKFSSDDSESLIFLPNHSSDFPKI